MSVDLKTRQKQFADYIRDPDNHLPPGDVKIERMLMYRELFFNNIEGFLASNFPVLKSLLSEADWLSLVQDFFAGHGCVTPHFSEIPEEFLDYLQNERKNPADLPFMLELAHYEWVEMALTIAKDTCPVSVLDQEDLLNSKVALSALAWPLVYLYPVHQISPTKIPELMPADPTFLVVYRNSEFEVGFIQITPLTYRLLEYIQEEKGDLLKDQLSVLAKEAAATDEDAFLTHGAAVCLDLFEKGIIY
jgi:uncharacterized protein